jgi:hypothetical protein
MPSIVSPQHFNALCALLPISAYGVPVARPSRHGGGDGSAAEGRNNAPGAIQGRLLL